jgi:hypothetical protein
MKKSVKFNDKDEKIEAPVDEDKDKRSHSSSSSGSASSSSEDQGQIDKLNYTIAQLNLKINSLQNFRSQQDKILKDQKTELSEVRAVLSDVRKKYI